MQAVPDIWAVVPAKQTADAKQRLASEYPADFRRALALAMLEDVLTALTRCRDLAGVIVVTCDESIAARGRSLGTEIFEDGARAGHTGAVNAAIARLVREDRNGILTVPGDIPLITPDEVSRLVAAHRCEPAFTIVPAHDRRGSNAIIMTPPDAVPLAFGDDSFLPHLAAARRCGIEPTVVPLPGIGLDIDNPQDLQLLLKTQSAARGQTRAWACLRQHRIVPA